MIAMCTRLPSRPRPSDDTGRKNEFVDGTARLFTVFRIRLASAGDAMIIFSASENAIFAWSRRRRGVDLRALLAVGDEPLHRDAGGERRLAVAFALLDVRSPEPAVAVGAEPAEDRADDEALRRLQHERLAGVLAFREFAGSR
jgi:hypothetical protein